MNPAAIFRLPLVLWLGFVGACGDTSPTAETPAPTPETKAAEGKTHGLTDEQATQVLAKIGDTTITVGEFAERLADQSPYLRARYNSAERRKEFLDNMIRFELLALEAKKRGHDKRPEVQRIRRQVMVQEMMKKLFDDKGIKLSDITEEEIKAYYDAHLDEFEKSPQRRASRILVKDGAKARSLIEELNAKPKDMQLFRRLAKENNEDEATAERYGDLRFFSKAEADGDNEPKVALAIRTAAFTLEKVGDVYPQPVKTQEGHHVIMLTGKRAALTRTLEEARRLIQNRLWRKKREAAIDGFVADLRKKANVQEDLKVLDQVKVDMRAPEPPIDPLGAD